MIRLHCARHVTAPAQPKKGRLCPLAAWGLAWAVGTCSGAAAMRVDEFDRADYLTLSGLQTVSPLIGDLCLSASITLAEPLSDLQRALLATLVVARQAGPASVPALTDVDPRIVRPESADTL